MFYYIHKFKQFLQPSLNDRELWENLRLMTLLGEATPWGESQILERFHLWNFSRYFKKEVVFVSDCGVGGRYVEQVIPTEWPAQEVVDFVKGRRKAFLDEIRSSLESLDNETLKAIKRLIDEERERKQ